MYGFKFNVQVNSQDQARRGTLGPRAIPAGVRSGKLLEGRVVGRLEMQDPRPQISWCRSASGKETGERVQDNYQEEKLPRRPWRNKREDKGQFSWDGQGASGKNLCPWQHWATELTNAKAAPPPDFLLRKIINFHTIKNKKPPKLMNEEALCKACLPRNLENQENEVKISNRWT